MGSHNSLQRGTGYNLVDLVGWYHANNVKTLTFDNDYPSDNTYSVRAHGLSQDSTSNSVYHVIKIAVYEGLTYYVEVRRCFGSGFFCDTFSTVAGAPSAALGSCAFANDIR